MFKQKAMHLLFLLSVSFVLIDQICGQMSESSTALDLITDSMKSVFNLDHVLKTFRKISEGVIPFPLFVPIVPKNKVIELLRGKKSSKALNVQDTLEQISEFNAKLNKLPIQVPIQAPIQVPVPMTAQQMMTKLTPNLAIPEMPQMSEQLYLNVRPTHPEVMPEIPFVMNEGLSAGQPYISDNLRPNDLNLDNDYEQSEGNDNNDNIYAERFESDVRSQGLSHSDDKRTQTAQDVLHNWQIIDEELKKIGQQLGKLGKYLNRNGVNGME